MTPSRAGGSDRSAAAPRRDAVLSLTASAERLGVHYMTAYRYVRTGRLHAVKEAGEWRVRPGDIDRFLEGAGEGRRPRRGTWATSRLLARLLAGDEHGAWDVVEAALTSGADPAEVHLALLAPALRRLGEGWEEGSLTIADEHRASVVARRLIGRLGPRFSRRGRKRGVVVVGAVAGERHEIPVAIVADQLRGAGFDVADLGADTPPESFAAAAAELAPFCVLVSVTGPGHEQALVETVRALGPARPVLIGGAAVPDEVSALRLGSKRFTGNDARSVVAAVEEVRGS